MSTHPFSLTAPAVIQLKPDSSGSFTVLNSGTKALTVNGSLGRYTDKTLHYPAASHATLTTFDHPWITFTPAHFTLAPGQTKTIRIADKVPAGTTGDHGLNLVWTAQPANTSAGNMHLNGAVASSVTIHEPGVAVAVTTHGLAQAPALPATSGFPTLLLLVPILLAFVVVLVLVWRTRLRRRTA